jgi:hypothetical protein
VHALRISGLQAIGKRGSTFSEDGVVWLGVSSSQVFALASISSTHSQELPENAEMPVNLMDHFSSAPRLFAIGPGQDSSRSRLHLAI